MMKRRSICLGLTAAGGGLLLQACSPEAAEAPASDASVCVEIPDGYYLFEDGKLSPASDDMEIVLPEDEPAQAAAQAEPEAPASPVQESIDYDWLSVTRLGPVQVLTGTAPDAETRDQAFSRLQDRAGSRRDGGYVVDGITVSGNDAPAGARLASLQSSPNIEACQAAADDIMDERTLRFSDNESAIADRSERLMNAIAGLAMVCGDYTLEIGVHTDARGADSYNLSRSERRAQAISSYLADAGVGDGQVEATGYGETQPLDPAQTSAAYALNSRVELTFVAESE